MLFEFVYFGLGVGAFVLVDEGLEVGYFWVVDVDAFGFHDLDGFVGFFFPEFSLVGAGFVGGYFEPFFFLVGEFVPELAGDVEDVWDA